MFTQKNKKKTEKIIEMQDENHIFETMKTLIFAIVIAVTIRSVAFEPFSIPSGSMVPSLLVGDYLFVSKYSYGYSQYSFPLNIIQFPGRVFYQQPERGDVAVFKKPNDEHIDYIKRIVGLPGDKIQVIEGRLYVNDEVTERRLVGGMPIKESFGNTITYRRYEEILPGGVVHEIIERTDNEPLDQTPAYVVPEEMYFVMGDNRDGSQDSRVMDKVGFVPEENLVGRAEIIFFSLEEGARPWEFWKWPWSIRFSRLFQKIV